MVDGHAGSLNHLPILECPVGVAKGTLTHRTSDMCPRRRGNRTIGIPENRNPTTSLSNMVGMKRKRHGHLTALSSSRPLSKSRHSLFFTSLRLCGFGHLRFFAIEEQAGCPILHTTRMVKMEKNSRIRRLSGVFVLLGKLWQTLQTSRAVD